MSEESGDERKFILFINGKIFAEYEYLALEPSQNNLYKQSTRLSGQIKLNEIAFIEQDQVFNWEVEKAGE